MQDRCHEHPACHAPRPQPNHARFSAPANWQAVRLLRYGTHWIGEPPTGFPVLLARTSAWPITAPLTVASPLNPTEHNLKSVHRLYKLLKYSPPDTSTHVLARQRLLLPASGITLLHSTHMTRVCNRYLIYSYGFLELPSPRQYRSATVTPRPAYSCAP